jgi:hypothetical protein
VPNGDNFKRGFVRTIEQDIARLTGLVFVRQFNRVVAKPFDVYYGNILVREDALDDGAAGEVFEKSQQTP